MPISSGLGVGSTPPEQSASGIVAMAATGSHTLTLEGYSRIKKLSGRWISGKYWITSATFTVGGHSWSAEFLYREYRHGYGLIHMLLRLRCTHCSHGEGVQARYTFSILDHNEQPSYISESSGEVDTFISTGSALHSIGCVFLESRATAYLRGDSLKLRCDITVYKELRIEDRDVPARLVAVPPSDMGAQLGRLLSSGFGADHTFEVDGETFAVHRNILAVRSPVLLEEIVSGSATRITEAGALKALLHYIYTDSLPEIDEAETTDMARRLMPAANRYGLDRLKLICKDLLCRRVDACRVADTMVVAE